MKFYALNEPAMFVITPDVAIAINMLANGDTRDPKALTAKERLEMSDVNLAYEVIDGCNNAIYRSEFTGTASSIRPTAEREVEFEDDFLAGITSDKVPSLFSTAYPSYDVLVAEFREKLKGVVPDGFPIEDHLYSVSGTYYC